MAPPLVCGKLPHRLLRAAAYGDLRRFKRIASALDGSKGRIREAVEAVLDGNGGGALHVAAAHGRTRVCAYLVEELQMDVNAIAVLSGDTPLSCAVRSKKNVDAVRYLLDHDADPNKRVHHGCTPLSIAVGKGICVMVELLLSKGADVNSLSCRGTPLHVAAMENHGAVMKILLDYNADSGLLPIEIAAFENRWKDVEILFRVTSRIPSVHDWSVDGVLTYVKSLLTDQDDPVYTMNLADLKLEGSKAYNKKDYSTAVKLYSVAIMKADSGDATLLSNRSLCFIKMGEGDKALVDAKACRALQPCWPKACFRQGAAHMLLKDYEKACDAFLDGLKLDPANAEMENALRESLNYLKISRATTKLSELSLAQKILCKIRSACFALVSGALICNYPIFFFALAISWVPNIYFIINFSWVQKIYFITNFLLVYEVYMLATWLHILIVA